MTDDYRVPLRVPVCEDCEDNDTPLIVFKRDPENGVLFCSKCGKRMNNPYKTLNLEVLCQYDNTLSSVNSNGNIPTIDTFLTDKKLSDGDVRNIQDTVYNLIKFNASEDEIYNSLENTLRNI